MSRFSLHRSAFTLIELIVVVLIIATLAALVIPQIAMLTRSSDMAASAKTQADLANNIQMFFALQKRFPQGLDSLIDTTNAVYGAADSTGAATTSGNLQTSGLPAGGADGTTLHAQLTPWVITNADDATGTGSGGSFRSFSRAGFDWVYNHSRTIANSNNSGITRVDLASGVTVAELVGTPLVTTDFDLVNKLVPQGLQAGQRLVALGIGPRNTAVSKTITNCPTYPGADGRYYGRYVAVFMVYATGERASLVGVVDAYGRHPDYTQQQFNESLPDGSRQG